MPADSGRAARRTAAPPVDVWIDRRRFLFLTGAAAAAALLQPALSWAKKFPAGAPMLQPWSLPDDVAGAPADIARALIGAAILAPSSWNTQPWRFESEQNVVRIVLDAQRALGTLDPDRRNLHLSLGAALENLCIAARGYGLRPSVSYLPEQGPPGTVASVAWSPSDVRRDRSLFVAIPERRTNRHAYDGRGIYLQNRAQLGAQIPDDFRLHWLDDRDKIHRLADVTRDAVKAQLVDAAAAHERYTWMRFGDDETRRGDGISVDQFEIDGLAHWFAGRYFNPDSWMFRFGPENAAKQARAQVRSSGAMALLTTPRGGPAQWLAGGQAYERFALKATTLGVAHHPMSEPLDRDATRAEVMRLFGAGNEQPLMLVRLGHAKAPGPSSRRNINLVASFRTT